MKLLDRIKGSTPATQPAKLIPVTTWSEARHDPPKPISTLRRWCRDGRIPGARREGREWRVPSNAEYSASGAGASPNAGAGPINLEKFLYGR